MFLLLLLVSYVSVCFSDGLPEDIYYKIKVPEGTACYRLLNGTHQFGCHSSKADGRGVVIVVKTDAEANAINSCWRDRFPEYFGGYFVMIDSALLTSDVISLIRSSECVRGLLLTDRGSYTISSRLARSDDSRCPNQGSSFYTDGCEQNAWNEKGATIPEGLRHVDWKKQIVFLYNETDIENVEQCYRLFNTQSTGGYPYCAASFSLRNTAAGNTAICYRRSQKGARIVDMSVDEGNVPCQPLGGRSTIAMLPPNPFNKARPYPSTSKYMMLAQRLDSFGLVPEISPGEISVMTSLVAMLSAARAIGNHYEAFEAASNASNNYLILTLFTGESFDYIGSTHIMYDMSIGEFPWVADEKSSSHPEQVIPSQIVSVVEVQQLGTGNELFLLADGSQMVESRSQVDRLVSSLRTGASSKNVTLSPPQPGGRMPPSSWHGVAKFNPSAVGIVIAPFEKQYTYTRVNSLMDRVDWDEVTIAAVRKQVSAAASAIVRAAADHVQMTVIDARNIVIDEQFTKIIFDCLVLAPNIYECPMMKTFLPKNYQKTPFYGKDTYVSVHRSLFPVLVNHITVFATGTTSHTGNVQDETACNDLEKGQKLYLYRWMADPFTKKYHCYRHSVFADEATSPAFLIKDYDFTNTTFSTWTESMYELDDFQLYLVQPQRFELWMLISGLMCATLSCLVVGRCSESTFIIDEGEQAAEEGEPL